MHIKTLHDVYNYLDEMFKGMNKLCLICGDCCRSYCWLLKEEAEKFLELNIPILKVNESFCIDSFERKNGKILLDKIPQCKFFREKRCLIYPFRPLFCRLYPLKMVFKSNKKIIFIGDLECPFILNANTQKLQEIAFKLKKLLENMDNKLLLSIFTQYYKISKITKIFRTNFIEMLIVNLKGKSLKIKVLI